MKICVRMLWIAGFAVTLTLGGCGKEEARTTESGAAPVAGSAAPAPTVQTAPASQAPAAAAEAAPDAALAAAPADAGANAKGKEIYDQACHVCHAAGIAGAPRFGDTAAWEPRIAQGMDLLHEHSIKGYTGKTGSMPPKGGRLDFSDEDVKAAVDYMVGAAR